MGYVTQIKMGDTVNPVASSLIGICSTEAEEQTKIVVCVNFTKLIEGVTIRVLFEHGNSANHPHINVNGTGKSPILTYNNEFLSEFHSWQEQSIVTLTYFAGAWHINDYQKPVEFEYDNNDGSLFIGRRF